MVDVQGGLAILLAWLAFAVTCVGEESTLPETVTVRGAEFTVGTPLGRFDSAYHKDETRKKVKVAIFRIGKFPVTAAQMCEFLNSSYAQEIGPTSLYYDGDLGEYTYSTITRNDDQTYVPRANASTAPANQVTWKGAAHYCRWLSQQHGRNIRLPTEAEWELAARGKEGRKWPWGAASPTAQFGPRYDGSKMYNSAELAERKDSGEPTWTIDGVGTHPRNATPDGVFDMFAYLIGEWCVNKYEERPTAETMTDATIDLEDLTSSRVVRGYYHKYRRSLIPFPLAETGYHLGRPWTRISSHPLRVLTAVEKCSAGGSENGG